MKTMLRLAKTHNEISVVCDQVGTPTYAKDLAEVILNLINSKNQDFGLYHYSNKGVASWYDFAMEIFDITKKDIYVNPIPTLEYPTPAQRPFYSVMDKTKITNNLGVSIPYWRDSLKLALKNFKKN